MSRVIAASAAIPSNLWSDLRNLARGLSHAFAGGTRRADGLDDLEREHARIRLQSRHWGI